jgi:hypothetical protein
MGQSATAVVQPPLVLGGYCRFPELPKACHQMPFIQQRPDLIHGVVALGQHRGFFAVDPVRV